MPSLIYAPAFVKQFNKLELALQEEIYEKVEMFRDIKNHDQLKVHKLNGPFSGCYSFSVNYKIRIVFQYSNKTEAALLAVGSHEIYK